MATFIGQHWIVRVGDYLYQAGDSDGYNKAFRMPRSSDVAPLGGYTRAGETARSDEEIAAFVGRWNTKDKGQEEYGLLTNSCQTFAFHLVHFLCDGEGKLPTAGGLQVQVEDRHFVATAGLGEIASLGGAGAKVALTGTNVGIQGIAGQGFFMKAELYHLEAGVDTPLGRVGVHQGINLNTGAGLRDGNAEATVLGLGWRVGKDGVGLRTPGGGVDCGIM